MRSVYDTVAPWYAVLHCLWLAVAAGSSERRLHRNLQAVVTPHARVLDAGGGYGRLARRLQRVAPSLHPVLLDRSAVMLACAGRALRRRVCADLSAIPFPPATFDVVVAGWVIETTADPGAALDECVRVLRPGGHLLYAYAAVPTSRWARVVSAPVRRVVRRRFAGQFLDPRLRPTMPHQELCRYRGRRQLVVTVTVQKPA